MNRYTPMAKSITKSTTLEGFYATDDFETFCFDRHEGPVQHHKVIDAAEHSGRSVQNLNECRVYPESLLPPETRGKQGRWTITIEFEPYETGSN